MSTFVDFHVLHSVPYSNLNRDDLGTPKTAPIGGVMRARISSQCQKRAARLWLESDGGLDQAYRSRALPEKVRRMLIGEGWNDAEAWSAIWALFAVGAGIDIETDRNGAAQGNQLTFTTADAVDKFVRAANTNRQMIVDLANKKGVAPPSEDNPKGNFPNVKGTDRDLKKILDTAATDALHGVNPVIALMGRFLADVPGARVDGALQVAHSLTTHAASIEPDYFTAVDDLLADGETGAGHVNANQFTSGVFYRYATIGLGELDKALGDGPSRDVITSFLSAFVLAEPTGKRTATAPHTLPSLVAVAVRRDRPVSFSDAFESPVLPRHEGGYLPGSIKALSLHSHEIGSMYGDRGIEMAAYSSLSSIPDPHGLGRRADSLEELTSGLGAAIEREGVKE